MLCNHLLLSECRFQREGGAHPDRRGWTAKNNVGLKVCCKHLIACILNAYLAKDSA